MRAGALEGKGLPFPSSDDGAIDQKDWISVEQLAGH